MKRLIVTILTALPLILTAGNDYWQQRVEYLMEIDFDVRTHRFEGVQKITYFNNSPDTLTRAFYHLYFNAFQPGSMMNIRALNLPDANRKMQNKLANLRSDEIGYHHINSLKQDGKNVEYEVNGTILEVQLPKPVMPGESTVFEMEFDSQVPVQIRRSGRDNVEGISYSMSQWYPKLCEYDEDGWHPNPYIAREFYGVWGDFELYLTIDKEYTVGGTGYLQNPEQIGHGYQEPGSVVRIPDGDQLTWHFIAPNVHDFVWAADPDYRHTKHTAKDGTELHFLYQENEENSDAWAALPEIMDAALQFINEHYGQYPYDQYSFVQGGDGGMEYPMATLITGNRSLNSLVGVSVHELLHSWYHMILGTNESLYAWMDEGFTEYAESMTMNELAKHGLLAGRKYRDKPLTPVLRSYANFTRSGLEEPLTTHADHFVTNSAYAVASYTKGNIFLHQLKYIVGDEVFDKIMLRYFDEWKFKHPDADDFMRVAEKTSGLVLDWYKEYWINTTHVIDYAVSEVNGKGRNSTITLTRRGAMPMPMEVRVTVKNGDQITYYMPLVMMRGAKPLPEDENWVLMPDWPWTNPVYELQVPIRFNHIAKVELDPDNGTADVNRENNDIVVEGNDGKP